MYKVMINKYPINHLSNSILHKITCDAFSVANGTLFAYKIIKGIQHTEKYEINENMFITFHIEEKTPG